MSVIELKFPKCCQCGERATKKLELVEWDKSSDGEIRPGGPIIEKMYCAAHYPEPLDRDQLALLLDDRDAEITRLKDTIRKLRSEQNGDESRTGES